MAFSEVTWMLHLVMPSMSEGRRPASSSASFAASSAVTSSGRPMSLANGSWPMPAIAVRSFSDPGRVYHTGSGKGERSSAAPPPMIGGYGSVVGGSVVGGSRVEVVVGRGTDAGAQMNFAELG